MEATELNLNRSQALLHIVNANFAALLGPRASGKTTGGIGPRIAHLSEAMPRSQAIFFSDTFERIHDKLIPNIVSFIENEMGYVDGQDYVAFKKPPEHFADSLIKLNKFDHVLSFASGFRLCCASQKVSGSANGYNAQALIVDEAKFVKPETLTTEVLPAIRGARRYFGHLPEYASQWYFTDKWEGDINWLLKLRDHHMNLKLIKAVTSLQLHIYELKEIENDIGADKKIKAKILHLENKLQTVRRDLVYVCDAEPFENIDNLGDKYYRDLRRNMSELQYEISILNRDPDKVAHSFYPAYIPIKHDYHTETNEDIDLNKPVVVALDYQWRITPLVAGQFGILPGKLHTSFNILAGVHSLHEEEGGIEKTIGNFCELMKSLGYCYNVVYYVYDHTAVAKSPATKPFYILVEDAFRKRGWSVNFVNIGKASEHNLRFESFKQMMVKEGDNSIRFNYGRTSYLRKAVQLAGAISSSGKTKKDKSKEKNLSVPATDTTDYTEALDQLLWAAVELKMIPQVNEAGFEIITR